MKIPQVADRLREIAAEAGLSELSRLADELRRRPAGRKARPSSRPMTDELAREIRAYRRANPHLSQVEISRRFNVNQGRVSEVLKGVRT